jgi:hypothetical protein
MKRNPKSFNAKSKKNASLGVPLGLEPTPTMEFRQREGIFHWREIFENVHNGKSRKDPPTIIPTI